MEHDARDHRHATAQLGAAGAAPVPGRRTLVEGLPRPTPPSADEEPGADPIARLVAQAGSGSAGRLPEALRERLEAALGTGLSDVRIHTSGEAAAAAGSLGARAFAVGQDVFFAAGEYDPSSPEGEALIAHEVAHTVQQRGATHDVQTKLAVSDGGDAHEAEADRFAESFVAGGGASATPATAAVPTVPTVPVSPVAAGTVARKAIARQAQGVTVLRGGQQSTTLPPTAAAAPTDRERAGEAYLSLLTELIAEFILLDGRLAGAFLPYKWAYELHVGALRAHAARVALQRELMMNVLFVGLGGMAGAWIQTVVRGVSSALLATMAATGAADIVKYGTRQAGGEGRRLPDPIAPSGDDPHEWLASARQDISVVQATVLLQVNAARAAALERGIDPAQLAAMRAQLDVFRGLARPRPQTDYALDLWRPWLQQALSQVQRRIDLGLWRLNHRDLMQAIRDQCGDVPGLTLLVEEICSNAATGPGAYEGAGHPVGRTMYGCEGSGFTGPGTDPAPARRP
jgi:hypothetical protein